MDINRKKSVLQYLALFPIKNHYQDFYFMIANKFLGAASYLHFAE